MKKYFILLAIALGISSSCKKSELNLLDPNAPTPSALTTQTGIEQFALGMFQKWIINVPGEGGTNVMEVCLDAQSIMGDEEWCSAGNWALRWTDQVYAITLPAPYNTKVINPNGLTQQAQLQSQNSRAALDRNAFQFEWSLGYFEIGQANILLQALSAPGLSIPASEKSALQAWAYWWKGVYYSRIGSLYLSGVINNNTNGTTNTNFVPNTAIITEANNNFNSAITILSGLTEDANYDAAMAAIIPNFNQTAGTITPAMWVREMYTYEARNYLANHKVATMTATDWTAITALANKGLVSTDLTFEFGMDPNGVNDLSGDFFHPFMFHSYDINPGWSWVSERLIQDIKPGDARLAKGFKKIPAGSEQVNRSARGLQFGTSWQAIPIENGGLYSTDNQVGQLPWAGSWEENSLMLAEASIHTSAIDAGLAIVDKVRVAQGAGLPAVSGTGLTLAQAMEEVRKERRIALYLRGCAFYDARRLGITAPATSGGGRQGIVLVPGSLIGSASFAALSCFMEYNYMDYWDVPANELDFNSPASTTVPVKN